MNCVYCFDPTKGTKGIYRPIGRQPHTCGFCNGTGIGTENQFVELKPQALRFHTAILMNVLFVSAFLMAVYSVSLFVLRNGNQ